MTKSFPGRGLSPRYAMPYKHGRTRVCVPVRDPEDFDGAYGVARHPRIRLGGHVDQHVAGLLPRPKWPTGQCAQLVVSGRPLALLVWSERLGPLGIHGGVSVEGATGRMATTRAGARSCRAISGLPQQRGRVSCAGLLSVSSGGSAEGCANQRHVVRYLALLDFSTGVFSVTSFSATFDGQVV